MKKLFTTVALCVTSLSSSFAQSDMIVSTFAGCNQPVSLTADGQGKAAGFNNPVGVVLDAAGNIYVADQSNYAIRKITPGGLVSTFAGTIGTSGNADGQGTDATFGFPNGITIDASGNLFVSDSYGRTIRKITPGGLVSTFAGSGSYGDADGQGTAASFGIPAGLAFDASGNLYVADQGNNKIKKITPGGLVSTFAGGAHGAYQHYDGQGTDATFNNPYGLAFDALGNLYVADQYHEQIRIITSDGYVSTYAGNGGSGHRDGKGADVSFGNPTGLTVDASGNMYVADWGNAVIRKITSDTVVSTFAGSGFRGNSDGKDTLASFTWPTGIAVDASGNIYVADTENNLIRKITPDGVTTTIAGQDSYGYANGQGTAARFYFPIGVVFDATGNMFVTDQVNNEIKKITPGGLVSTFAGHVTPGSADGQGTDARFYYPAGIAIDASGNLYIADTDNHLIRKVTPGGLVSTLAGSGTQGSADGQGTDASFYYPWAVAVDASGYVYVSDRNNNLIRKISPDGLVSTFAGSGASTDVDGQGTAAALWSPSGITIDVSGNIYVVDAGNVVRKITPGGLVSTIAGGNPNVGGNFDGQGTDAAFQGISGIIAGPSGYLYVSDGSSIREISPDSVVTTISGVNASGFMDGPVSDALFSSPMGMAFDASGNLFVADFQNSAIRKISSVSKVTTGIEDKSIKSSVSYYPNPAKDVLNITTSDNVNGVVTIVDLQGNVLISQPINGTKSSLSTTGLSNGLYVVKLVSETTSNTNKVIISR